MAEQQLPPTHPVADIWPLMCDAELDALAADIQESGQYLPIIRVDGLLLDGRNRWLACKRADVEPWIKDVEADDPDALAWSLNEHRRHAPHGMRVIAAAKRETLKQGDNQHTAQAVPSQSEVAERFGVSVDSLQRGRKVLDYGDPLIIDAVQSDDLAVKLAAKTVQHMQETGQEFTNLADLKKTMRKLWREDHPEPEITEQQRPKREERSHVSVDTFGVINAIVRHANEHPPAQAAAQIDKWTRLNILDDLPPAIEYLNELHAALGAGE